MAGLGNYTLSPQLDGSMYVYHPAKKLSGSYADENDFLYYLQKHDWKLFYDAVSTALQAVHRLQLASTYTRNAAGAFLAYTKIHNAFATLHRDTPEAQGRTAKYMLEMFPRLACTSNQKENQVILQALELIQEYYDRYLAKYETFKNSFLTA